MRASRFYASSAVFTVFAFYRTPDCPKEQFYFVRATVARGLNEPTSPTPGGRSQIKMGIWDGIASIPACDQSLRPADACAAPSPRQQHVSIWLRLGRSRYLCGPYRRLRLQH
jgi:hypothetical protein